MRRGEGDAPKIPCNHQVVYAAYDLEHKRPLAITLAEVKSASGRVLSMLRQYPSGLTTRQIAHAAEVCAVNSCVSELRQRGYAISCRRTYSSQSSTVYVYRLGAR